LVFAEVVELVDTRDLKRDQDYLLNN